MHSSQRGLASPLAMFSKLDLTVAMAPERIQSTASDCRGIPCLHPCFGLLIPWLAAHIPWCSSLTSRWTRSEPCWHQKLSKTCVFNIPTVGLGCTVHLMCMCFFYLFYYAIDFGWFWLILAGFRFRVVFATFLNTADSSTWPMLVINHGRLESTGELGQYYITNQQIRRWTSQ